MDHPCISKHVIPISPSGINALVSSLYVRFRSFLVTTSNYTTFIQGASQYNVTLQNGSDSLLGGLQRTGPSADNRNDTMIINMEYSDNLFNVESDSYLIFIPWNRSPKVTLMTGSSAGYCAFTGFEVFKWITPSTLSAGNYQIDIWARSLCTLHSKSGVLSVTQ